MATKRPSRFNIWIRIFMWLLAVIAAAFFLIIVLQQLQLIDFKFYIPGAGEKSIPPPSWKDMELLDQDRINQLMIANDQRREELDVLAANLNNSEIKLEEQRKQLEKERNAVEEEKKRLRQGHKLFEKKEETIAQTALELTMMDEKLAVKVLEKRDNQDIIWIMRVADKIAEEKGQFSVVPIWLELLDPARAAEIQRERDLIPKD